MSPPVWARFWHGFVSRRITFARSNTRDDGCDEQQPEFEFHHPLRYRPTNTGSASLDTCVVRGRATANQVQGEAEAY